MAAILDGGRGHRTQFWKYTTQVTLTSVQDDHLQQTYCSFNIGPYGKKCFKIFSSETSEPI
jgi:hypothetical protein